MSNHDDDGGCKVGQVLLILNTLVHRDQDVKSMGGGEAQQVTVAAAGSSHLLDRSHSELIGKERTESLWNGLVKQ